MLREPARGPVSETFDLRFIQPGFCFAGPIRSRLQRTRRCPGRVLAAAGAGSSGPMAGRLLLELCPDVRNVRDCAASGLEPD